MVMALLDMWEALWWHVGTEMSFGENLHWKFYLITFLPPVTEISTVFPIHSMTRSFFWKKKQTHYSRLVVARHVMCILSSRSHLAQGLYSLNRLHLTGIWIPIRNLRRSDDRLRFIMGIPILIRRSLRSEKGPRCPIAVCCNGLCYAGSYMIPIDEFLSLLDFFYYWH